MEFSEIGLTLLSLLTLVLGYFLRMIHTDVRNNTEETGRNKGRFEQLEIQLKNEREVRQLENKNSNELTQQNLQQLTKEVMQLTKSVEILISNKINEK